MKSIRSLLVDCAAAFMVAFCAAVSAAPQTGWWWNPAESGRGFFVESDNGITFIGAYLYDADGHATWLVAGGTNSDPYNYTGQLYSMRSGQTLFGSYVSPVGPDDAGTISVRFTDDTHGTVTWPGGTVAIERHVYGGAETAFRPAPGWWWNSDESGSGYSIEVQGDNLFFVGFMYDDSGRPVWYFSAGPMDTFTTYKGELLRFANGQTIDGPYRPPATPVPVGTVGIDFLAWDIGRLTFSPALATGLVAQGHAKATSPRRTVNFRPQFKKSIPGGRTRYANKFLIEQKGKVGPGFDATFTFSGDLIWERYNCGNTASRCYFAKYGTLVVNVTADLVLPAGAGNCHGSGVRTFRRYMPTASYLEISGDTWQASIDFEATVPFTVTCTVAGQTSTQTSSLPVGWNHSTKDRSVQNQVPSPVNLDIEGPEDVYDQNGGFWEYYGVQVGNDIVEKGYVIFFPH